MATQQPYERLEQEWATSNNLQPEGMVVCSSGTAALHLALEALQLPPGSEVVVPDFTMIAVPRAVVLAGLVPVFVDCGDDLLMDMGLFNSELGEERIPTAALIVHIYGRRCDMDAVNLAAAWEHFKVIEDLAEAHGVRPHPATDAACWSFYHNKIVHGEEGGAVWFRNTEHARLARSLRSLGFTEAHDFMHVPRGHNYRMSNAHARLVSDSLINVWNAIYARREVEKVYNRFCPQEWMMPERHAPWVYDIRIPGLTTEVQGEIVHTINEIGIAARRAFKPMTMQPEFQFRHRRVHSQWTKGGAECVTKAELASREVLYFPLKGVTVDEAEECLDVCRRLVG